MENAIEAGNLTKYFGDVLAVNHINLISVTSRKRRLKDSQKG